VPVFYSPHVSRHLRSASDNDIFRPAASGQRAVATGGCRLVFRVSSTSSEARVSRAISAYMSSAVQSELLGRDRSRQLVVDLAWPLSSHE